MKNEQKINFEDMAKIQANRTLIDAEKIKDGAKYVMDQESDKLRLEFTEEQVNQVRENKEQESKVEQKIVNFLEMIEPLKSTLRHNWTKSGRQESSAEHTWRASVFLMVVQDLLKFDINFEKTLKMLLIHDIPELVDGDVPGFVKDKNLEKYQNKESKNATQIFDKLPGSIGKEYLDLFLEFEKGETPEAMLALALDRIESQLQHLESGSKYWSKSEAGEHMLNFPNKALKNLNNEKINKIWDIIKKEIELVNNKMGFQ